MNIEIIRERWRVRTWPHIGWFVHAQALMDIDALLAEIDRLRASSSATGERT